MNDRNDATTKQYLVIYDELIMNFVLALAAVAVLSLLVLGRIGVVAVVCLTVVSSGCCFVHVSVFFLLPSIRMTQGKPERSSFRLVDAYVSCSHSTYFFHQSRSCSIFSRAFVRFSCIPDALCVRTFSLSSACASYTLYGLLFVH